MQWKRHLGRALAAGTAAALLVFVPFTEVHRAQAAGLEDQSGKQTYMATSETGDAVPQDMLPDFIDDSIPENATVVAKDVAVTDQGDVKDMSTGELVTDKTVVGTPDHPADPLAKTGGRSFIPVPVKEVKEQLDQSAWTKSTKPAVAHEQTGAEQSAAVHHGVYHPQGRSGVVARPMALGNNGYGAHWGTYQGTPAFFEGNGTLFVQQAKGVVDVSQWQGRIDWTAARNSGVEGAIIRIGYGWGNGYDNTALYNIKECKRLGIPFGIYFYSYAYDGNTGRTEGDGTVDLLRRAGVSPGDLAYPVYYDLENWVWTGHAPPTSPAVYDGIVNAWYNRLQSAGYNKLSVYSYTFYLNSALNSGNIRSKTHWVASYGSRTGFNFPANQRCWQYADDGRADGISGTVDLNVCGNKDAVTDGVVLSPSDKLTDITEGDYYIGSAFANRYLDIEGGSMNDGAQTVIWLPTNGANQLYHVKPVGNGTYTITSKNSGKSLDIRGGSTQRGTLIIQYRLNSGANQRWSFYKTADGYVYIVSALGNGRSLVLDIARESSSPGSKLEIWSPNEGRNQRFRLMQAADMPSGKAQISSTFARGNSMDVPGQSKRAETAMQTWRPNGCDNQRFTLEYRGNGRYAIKNVLSQMYVDIQYGYQGDGGRIIQFPRTDGTNQLWYLQKYPRGYALRSVSNNKAIDISGMDNNPGAPLISYTFLSQDNQKWTIR